MNERGSIVLRLLMGVMVLVAFAAFGYYYRVAQREAELDRQIQAERQVRESERRRALAEQMKKIEAAEAEVRALKEKRERERMEALQREREAVFALGRLRTHAQRFDDANRVANSAPRISLAQPIAVLQGIRRDVEAVVVPSCLDGSKGALLSAMDEYIGGYLVFMARGDDDAREVVRRRFLAAKAHIASFSERADRCKATS